MREDDLEYTRARESEDEVCVCDFCGEPLLPGERLLRFGRTVFCWRCLEEMSAREALEELGGEMETVSRDGRSVWRGAD